MASNQNNVILQKNSADGQKVVMAVAAKSGVDQTVQSYAFTCMNMDISAAPFKFF